MTMLPLIKREIGLPDIAAALILIGVLRTITGVCAVLHILPYDVIEIQRFFDFPAVCFFIAEIAHILSLKKVDKDECDRRHSQEHSDENDN